MESKIESLKLEHGRLTQYLQGTVALSIGLFASRFASLDFGKSFAIALNDLYVPLSIAVLLLGLYFFHPQLVKVEKRLYSLKSQAA